MKILGLFLLLATQSSLAFVSGPSNINAGENYISFGGQTEGGKLEPNANRDSYQKAQIDIYKLKYARGFEGLLGLGRSHLYIEYGSFTSGKEQVGSTVFYEKDQGSYLTLGLSGDLVHDLEKQFGFYFQASPLRSYNKKKFSNPRVDTFALGLNSAFNITDNFFQKNLIHYGAGDGKDQNSYLAVDTGFGYRLNDLVGRQMTVTASLFLEADTSERFDASYDNAFSPTGTQDRIRAFKYGTVLGFDVAITPSLNLNFSRLEKNGGYDARATEVNTLNLGFKF